MAKTRKPSSKSGRVKLLGDDLFPWPWRKEYTLEQATARAVAAGDDLFPWPWAATAGPAAVLPADPAACLLTVSIDVGSGYRVTTSEVPIYAYVIHNASRTATRSQVVLPMTVSGIQELRSVQRNDDTLIETLRFIWTGKRWDPAWVGVATAAAVDWCSFAKGRAAIKNTVFEVVRGYYGEDG